MTIVVSSFGNEKVETAKLLSAQPLGEFRVLRRLRDEFIYSERLKFLMDFGKPYERFWDYFLFRRCLPPTMFANFIYTNGKSTGNRIRGTVVIWKIYFYPFLARTGHRGVRNWNGDFLDTDETVFFFINICLSIPQRDIIASMQRKRMMDRFLAK